MENEVIKVDYEIIDSSSALQALNSSEIDTQIATAHRFPRSIKDFKNKALEYATIDEDTAASMFYKLPRGGKKIEGPSVRLAEVVAATWGNIRAEAQVVGMDDKYVTAMGSCIDLETNYAVRHQVRRRITDKTGRRFNDDMIAVTANAACSVAYREAVFKVVPRAMVKSVYEAAKATAIGTEKTLSERRQRALAWFNKAGADDKQVFSFLGIKSLEEVTLDHLETLTGIKTSVSDGEIDIDTALKGGTEVGSLQEKLEDLKAENKDKKAKAKELLEAVSGKKDDEIIQAY